MTISKYIRRDHAYVGQTFSATRFRGRGMQNCILAGGTVSEVDPYSAPGAIVVAPFLLELGGLVIQSDANIPVEYTQPAVPGENLFLVVSSPDDTDASGLVWTVIVGGADYTAGFVFAVRQNAGAGAVWQQTPVGSLRAILSRMENPLEHGSERAGHVDASRFRPDVAGTTVIVRPPQTGFLASAMGAALGFDSGGFNLPDPHHAYTRRDRLVLRRAGAGPLSRFGNAMYGGDLPISNFAAEGPLDRMASIEVLPGVPRRSDVTAVATAFAQNDNIGAAGAAIDTGRKLGAAVNTHVSARDGTDTRATGYNDLYVAYQTAADDLQSARMSSDRSTVPAGTDIAAAAAGVVRTDHNVVILPSGEAIILYTHNGGAGQEDLYFSKVDADGLAFSIVDQLIYTATGLGGAADGIHRPRGFVDRSGSVQIVMEVELSPGGGGANGDGEALYWMKVSPVGVVQSQPVRLTDPSSGTTAAPAFQLTAIQATYDDKVLVSAIRFLDQTGGAGTGGTEAILLGFQDPSVVTQETVNDGASVAQIDRSNRALGLGSFQASAATSVVVAAGGRGEGSRAAVVFSSQDNSGGTFRRYVRYGPSGAPDLAGYLLREDDAWVSAIDLLHHSDQLGGSSPILSESSEQLAAVHDGSAVHVVGWDAVNGELVYERAVPHALHDLPFAGELTTRFNLLDVAGATDATEPSDLIMVRGASGEPLIVRIDGNGGLDAGAVIVTEIYGIEGEPDPLWPDVTVLAEFDIPPAGTDITPTMSESARVTRPARDLVVGGGGGPGALTGSSGLQLALEILRGTGGSIRVRAGFYDLFHALRLTSGISVECDPGAVFRARSAATEGVLAVDGETIFINTVDAAAMATFTGLGGSHLRVAGYTEGCLLREVATGDEYYVVEIPEVPDRFRVDDPSMPSGAYVLAQTGISWSGGTFVVNGGNVLLFNRAANVTVTRCHIKVMATAGATAVTRFSGCTDVTMRGLYCPLGTNGRIAATAPIAGAETNRRISLTESKFIGGAGIGWFSDWRDFAFTDLVFENNAGVMTVDGGQSSGRIDKIRGDLAMHLNILSSSRVVVGDTDFAFQVDSTRTGLFSDTLNKPNFTDAWFRGNVYVSGFLNHGQYDLAIMALATVALDDELFQLFGLVDGFSEDFLTFDGVELNAFYPVPSTSVAGRWYPGVAPLVLDAPGPTMPSAMTGLSGRVAPDYVLDGFIEVVEQSQFPATSLGGLRGRHASVRGVIHHEAVVAAPFTQPGWPDRGKIEFQASFGAAGEGTTLVGEASSYALLQQNLGTSGTDGEQLEFSSVRYDTDTGLEVGALANVDGKAQWQRIYDSYTSLDANRIAVVSTKVTNGLPGPSGWSLGLRVDLFDATSGAWVGGAKLANNGGASYGDDLLVHLKLDTGAASVDAYGELAEAKIVPDVAVPGEYWLFVVGRFWNNVLSPAAWECAVRVAKIDITATTFTPSALFIDVGGAGVKFKNLDSDSSTTARWRGLAVTPLVDDFNASVFAGATDNLAVSCMKTGGVGGTGVGTWLLNIGIFNETNVAFPAPGGMTTSTGAGLVGFIPCAMANDLEQSSMVGSGVILGTLSGAGSWPWKPLSGGSYLTGVPEPRAVFVVASSPDRTTWVGSVITAFRVSWGAASNWDAPNAADVLATGALSLSHFPGAFWDAASTRFTVPYATGNGIGLAHTTDQVWIDRVRWNGGPWVWAGAVSHRASAGPILRNLVSASLADQDDAAASQRYNVAWQSEPGALNSTWGSVQIDRNAAVTQDVWYDADNPEITAARSWALNLARYWMADREWDPGAELASPAATDTLDREHYLLYHRDQTSLRAKVFLRCVGRKLAVKVEIDVPWCDNLTGLDLSFIGGGETNTTGVGQDTGVDIYAQTGFRASPDLAVGVPADDIYAGGAAIASNADGWSGGLWGSAVATVTGALTVASNVADREVLTAEAIHADVAYAAGDRIILLQSESSGYWLTGLSSSGLLSLMVGGTVVLTGVGGPTTHRITYFGNRAGVAAMVIEPPVTFASHAVLANNTYEFRKRVTGAVLTPLSTGEASLVHPERIWVNRLDVEGLRAPELVGVAVDTSVNPAVVPPASVTVLLSLVDTDGSLSAAYAAGGASLDDYLTLYVARDAPNDWTQVSFDDSSGFMLPPLYQAPTGDGGFTLVVYAQHVWPVGPYSFHDVAYKVVWNSAGGTPGKRLHIDRVSMGWN